MKHLILSAILLCGPLCAADPHMTAEERAKVTGWLADSRREFLAAIDGLSDAQWKWKPAPERWSVAEVAEHIVLAEASQFGNVQKALASAPTPDWEKQTGSKTQLLEAVLAPRQGKAQAPEALVPGGSMTVQQVRERFLKQREAIDKFVAESTAPLKQYTIANPFFGPLNGYQWLIYAPLHTDRKSVV